MPSSKVLHTRCMIHEPMLQYWKERQREAEYTKLHRPTRFERYTSARLDGRTRGDVLLQRLMDVFNHGLGRKWSATQHKIFKAFVDAALPKIYGNEWEEVKVRVMKERRLDKESPWALVNMARRNGKTFVTSGTAAAFILAIPNLSVAIFSTGIRASQLLRSTIHDMLESAFDLGTHVQREGYRVIQKNKEVYVMEHPEGGKQVIGCYPGSVRVSNLSVFLLFHWLARCGFVCKLQEVWGIKKCQGGPAQFKQYNGRPCPPALAVQMRAQIKLHELPNQEPDSERFRHVWQVVTVQYQV